LNNHAENKDCSRYLNRITIRVFNGCRRELIYEFVLSVHRLLCFLRFLLIPFIPSHHSLSFHSVLFALLQQACLRLDVSVSPDAREAKHGELLIKCIWKRIRSLSTDLEDRNLVKALLETLEAFLRAMPPLEWRSRLMTNVPMGDMPFRTVKVLLQHIVGQSAFLLSLACPCNEE
jgi:cytoskeleton-associated protein 5